MAKRVTKRKKSMTALTQKGKSYELKEAIQILKSAPKAKFDQSVEVQCKLGVDLQASDQGVRGTTSLPHGQGKKLRVIVFCKDEGAKLAK